MGKAKHEDRNHAVLSASGASRWLNCTPSARLEEQFQEENTSAYAAEGTLAHEFGELNLRLAIHEIDEETMLKQAAELEKSPYYSDEMDLEVEKYTTYVMEQLNAARAKVPGALLLIEQKVDLTAFIQDGFGTNDSIIISDGTMEVVDLKCGKGVRVSAEDNSQLKLYGLGALLEHELTFDIHKVRLTIVQPRLDAISSWEISAEDLRAWGEQEVKPKAKMAYAGEGEQAAGHWCKWCKVKARCKALAEKNMELAEHDFADPELLTDEELIDIYAQMPQLQDWVNAVATYLLDEALKGKQWPGYKLVEGRANRKWLDESKVATTLLDNNFSADNFMVSTLAGLTAIEKLVGKKDFPVLLGGLVIKPQGKPTLVPESDKRPAMGIKQAKKDFEN